jgi:hypothetical protein
MYHAIIRRQKPRRLQCEACNTDDYGELNRLDCGCAWEEIVGQYQTAKAARMAAMAKARAKGTINGGIATGFWAVEDDNEDAIGCGYVDRPTPRPYSASGR